MEQMRGDFRCSQISSPWLSTYNNIIIIIMDTFFWNRERSKLCGQVDRVRLARCVRPRFFSSPLLFTPLRHVHKINECSLFYLHIISFGSGYSIRQNTFKSLTQKKREKKCTKNTHNIKYIDEQICGANTKRSTNAAAYRAVPVWVPNMQHYYILIITNVEYNKHSISSQNGWTFQIRSIGLFLVYITWHGKSKVPHRHNWGKKEKKK